MLHNPILPGFNPDPSMIYHDGIYYIATSTFEWFPAITIYKSFDLVNWEILCSAINDPADLDLRMVESAKGVWAPDLSYDEERGEFVILFTRMASMNARFFDLDNYLIHSSSIEGPYSKPIYLNSVGFDPSYFRDVDGVCYITSLGWETRDGKEKPGVIVTQRFDWEKERTVGPVIPIHTGSTDRGCIEGPRIYRINGYYYLFCAEGGTGYGHCVSYARSRHVLGPYETDAKGYVLTSQDHDFNARGDEDSLKSERYNPESYLQKSGHGSLVRAGNGRWYMAHLTARPFLPEKRCTLGRETALQEIVWNSEGYPRLASGGFLAEEYVPVEASEKKTTLMVTRFDASLPPCYLAVRIPYTRFSSLQERPGYLRLHGAQSLASLDLVSFIGRRLTSVNACFTCTLEAYSTHYRQGAGIVFYYDNMNYLFLHLTYDEDLHSPVIALLQVENGRKRDYPVVKTLSEPFGEVTFMLDIKQRETRLSYAIDGGVAVWVDQVFDTSLFSDEASRYGEFTGAFCGIHAFDYLDRSFIADFSSLSYEDRNGNEGPAKASL